MTEASKTKKIMGPLERAVLSGSGIDIGCGPDPITDTVRKFDVEDGDANQISHHVKEQFDFVFSSHCLEHMHNPRAALLDWWKLVKPGGHIYFLVPDEDLYEQGVFPSRFNHDHKATFTVFKESSWSPVSINVRDLAASLPNSELVSLVLQDNGYDRRLMTHGPSRRPNILLRVLFRVYYAIQRRMGRGCFAIERWIGGYRPVDQTRRPDVLAQIQCIVKKTA